MPYELTYDRDGSSEWAEFPRREDAETFAEWLSESGASSVEIVEVDQETSALSEESVDR
ncbi:hypothetical protein GCM10022224_001140 [Nonomuraea antimicrobica]|uniref:Uncharacterized protein n=1 Tax=Nonomuraea antimicrobica TaxID=561173 RepID=A0ABP7AYH3_9ACTN